MVCLLLSLLRWCRPYINNMKWGPDGEHQGGAGSWGSLTVCHLEITSPPVPSPCSQWLSWTKGLDGIQVTRKPIGKHKLSCRHCPPARKQHAPCYASMLTHLGEREQHWKWPGQCVNGAPREARKSTAVRSAPRERRSWAVDQGTSRPFPILTPCSPHIHHGSSGVFHIHNSTSDPKNKMRWAKLQGYRRNSGISLTVFHEDCEDVCRAREGLLPSTGWQKSFIVLYVFIVYILMLLSKGTESCMNFRYECCYSVKPWLPTIVALCPTSSHHISLQPMCLFFILQANRQAELAWNFKERERERFQHMCKANERERWRESEGEVEKVEESRRKSLKKSLRSDTGKGKRMF